MLQITHLAPHLGPRLLVFLQRTERPILRDVNFLVVQRELEVLQDFVLDMGVDRDVRNQDVTRVPRAALLTVRPMVEVKGANTWAVLKVLRGRQIIA